jgi:hypothetical protein
MNQKERKRIEHSLDRLMSDPRLVDFRKIKGQRSQVGPQGLFGLTI